MNILLNKKITNVTIFSFLLIKDKIAKNCFSYIYIINHTFYNYFLL